MKLAMQETSALRAVGMPPPGSSPRTLRLLNNDAAAQILKIARERRLSLTDLRVAVQFIAHPTLDQAEQIVSHVAAVSKRAGEDAEAFDRFIMLVAQNRGLNNQLAFASALDMANKQSRPKGGGISFLTAIGSVLSAGLTGGLLLPVMVLAATAQSAWNRHQATAGLDWDISRRSMAVFDMLITLSTDAATILSIVRTRAKPRSKGVTDAQLNLIKAITSPHILEIDVRGGIGDDIIEDLKFPKRLSGKLKDAIEEDRFDADEKSFIKSISFVSSIENFHALGLFKGTIDQLSHSEQRKTILELLANSLQPAFIAAEFPEDRQEAFILKLADALLEGAQSQMLGQAFVAPSPIALPTKAPELWPGGKATKETPPEFIMRVYAPWMGKGLTMATVRKLDEPLAQAMYRYLRAGRPLPENFDLPTKSEQVSREIDQLKEEGFAVIATKGATPEYVLREYERLRRAEARRNSRERSVGDREK